MLQVGPNVADQNDNNGNQDNVPGNDSDHASDVSAMKISKYRLSFQEPEWQESNMQVPNLPRFD